MWAGATPLSKRKPGAKIAEASFTLTELDGKNATGTSNKAVTTDSVRPCRCPQPSSTLAATAAHSTTQFLASEGPTAGSGRVNESWLANSQLPARQSSTVAPRTRRSALRSTYASPHTRAVAPITRASSAKGSAPSPSSKAGNAHDVTVDRSTGNC